MGDCALIGRNSLRPLLLVALRRLAETYFSEAMVWFAHQLASFGNLLAS
jgi:hypothetical protein